MKTPKQLMRERFDELNLNKIHWFKLYKLVKEAWEEGYDTGYQDGIDHPKETK